MSADRDETCPSQPATGLTDEEHEVMDLLAEAAEKLHRIIRAGGHASWPNDWNEAAIHIHGVQNMVLAQAAGRAHPNRYRLLGAGFEQ